MDLHPLRNHPAAGPLDVPAHVVAPHQFLGPLRSDQPGEQVGATAVHDKSATDEDLDELRRIRGQYEVTRICEMAADAGGGAVDRGDDRLLAVEHGRDEALRELPAAEAVIVDGDHNYYTISEELMLIGDFLAYIESNRTMEGQPV